MLNRSHEGQTRKPMVVAMSIAPIRSRSPLSTLRTRTTAEPEGLWNVQVRQGDRLAGWGALAPAIHKDEGRLRWQPLHDARHMVPASVGDAGFGKGTASFASVRELRSEERSAWKQC